MAVAMQGIFVTGTDTGVGKTRVATALLRALGAAGFRAAGMKPVAAGFEPGTSINADVAALCAAGNASVAASDVNPYAFAEAVAPHLAAQTAGVAIGMTTIVHAYRRLGEAADVVVVEGAGGAMVPLDARHDMLDVAAALGIPLLVVVGMRLGCLNHALLTVLAVRRRGLVMRGWIANVLPPGMPLADRNVDALTERLGVAPVLVIEPGAVPSFDAQTLALLGFAAGPQTNRANI